MKDKPSILVVDDDPSISRLVRLYLEKEGFEVRTAERGDEAVEEFRRLPPDLIRALAAQGVVVQNQLFELLADKSAALAGTKVLEGPSTPEGSQERIAYKVKSGDYLGRIASRYGVTVKQLQQWNNLRGTNLRVGQTLYIYRNGSGKASSSSSGS